MTSHTIQVKNTDFASAGQALQITVQVCDGQATQHTLWPADIKDIEITRPCTLHIRAINTEENPA